MIEVEFDQDTCRRKPSECEYKRLSRMAQIIDWDEFKLDIIFWSMELTIFAYSVCLYMYKSFSVYIG